MSLVHNPKFQKSNSKSQTIINFQNQICTWSLVFVCILANSRWILSLNLFQRLDLIAQAGGFLVILAIDRTLQALPQLYEFRLGFLRLRIAARRLAAMAGLTVDVF